MKRRGLTRDKLLIPALVCLALAAAMAFQLAQRYREDLYWTPMEESLSLDESRNRIEVYLEDELLEDPIARGQLRVFRDGRSVPVHEDSLRFRLNEMDKVEGRIILLLTALLTAGVTMLVVALFLPRPADLKPLE